MEAKENLIEPLLEKVQEYSNINMELLKLKSLYKIAGITSILVSRLLIGIVLSVGLLTLNIAFSLWIGEFFGKNYYGFLIVAAFYGLVGTVLFFIHSSIKSRVYNSLITQILN